MNCLKTNKECAICLQDTNITNKCTICSNTNICSDCMLGMVEHGQSHICPVCRQKDWVITIASSTKICPISVRKKKHFDAIEVITESSNKENDTNCCCPNCADNCNTIILAYRKAIYLLTLAALVSFLGGITFYMFNIPVIYIIEISIFIYLVLCMLCGFIEISCCWCCCCSSQNIVELIC